MVNPVPPPCTGPTPHARPSYLHHPSSSSSPSSPLSLTLHPPFLLTSSFFPRRQVTMPNGIRYQDLSLGKGNAPEPGDTCTVHYSSATRGTSSSPPARAPAWRPGPWASSTAWRRAAVSIISLYQYYNIIQKHIDSWFCTQRCGAGRGVEGDAGGKRGGGGECGVWRRPSVRGGKEGRGPGVCEVLLLLNTR